MLNPPSLTEVAERAVNGEVDLRDVSPAEQGAFLRALEEQHHRTGTIDANIYLLSERARSVLDGFGSIELGLHDIDGTHTTVGGHRLFDESLDVLDATSATGMRNVAVTGRHEWQVREIMENHRDAPPRSEEWLIEQGFYRMRDRGREAELFEGTPAIEQNVKLVRSYLTPLLEAVQAEHGIEFETTSLRGEGGTLYPHAHKTMFSVDALQHGRKITDRGLHERILDHITTLWDSHDPEHRIATPRTSSTGTFELTPDGINKEGAARSLLNECGLPAQRAVYLGDSSNDLPVFEGMQDLGGLFAMVNSHTKDELLKHADIATVCINPGPILWRIAAARAAAKTIVVS